MKKEKLKSNNLFQNIFYDTWIMMMAGSIVHLPSRWIERIFVILCLLFGLVVVGLFQVISFCIRRLKRRQFDHTILCQGTLTGLYSAEPYYKDIDTLEELDKSGLPIGTTSGSLGNVFKEYLGSSVIKSLDSKFTVWNFSMLPTIERTAFARDVCSIERLSDVKVIIAVILKYLQCLYNLLKY